MGAASDICPDRSQEECLMRIKEVFRKVEELFMQAGLHDSRRIAIWIFCDVLQCRPVYLVTHEEGQLEQYQAVKIFSMAARCALHEPVQYVLGYTEFSGLRLHLVPDVLIPRPETEQLVDVALEAAGRRMPLRVLDIGTGSGCIALAVKQAIPTASVTACDISKSALIVAKSNANKHKFGIEFTLADLLKEDFLKFVGGRYNLVISNPPYIPDRERSDLPRRVRNYEPKSALFCGADPLKFYRAIRRHMSDGLLDPGGVLAVEAHADYAESVGDLFREHSGLQVQVKQDLAGHSRFVIAQFD